MGIGAAVVGAVGSIAAGVIGSDAASSAADTQAAASQHAADIQKQIYDTTRSDLSPFVRAGQGGLDYLSSLIPGGLQLPGGGATAPATGTSTETNIPGVGTITLPPGIGGTPAGTPAPFQVTPSAPSPFLSNLESYLPGSGQNNDLTTLNNLSPGSKTPDSLVGAVRNFVPGANSTPSPLLSGISNFVPGGSSTPDETLTALRGFTPGTDHENDLTKTLNTLLGVQGGGSPDPAVIQHALEQTPGYQFTLDQGLKSVQNSYASKGLGSSGAAMKGAADYATGLSNQTYEQRLNDYLNTYNNEYANTQNSYNSQFTNNLNAYNTEFTNTYNTYGQAFNNALNKYNTGFANASGAYGQQADIASNLLSLGENAGAQTGQIGAKIGSGIASNIVGAGNATAAGIVGSSNAAVNAITGVGNAATTYLNSTGSNALSIPGAGSNLAGTAYANSGMYGGDYNPGALG